MYTVSQRAGLVVDCAVSASDAHDWPVRANDDAHDLPVRASDAHDLHVRASDDLDLDRSREQLFLNIST